MGLLNAVLYLAGFALLALSVIRLVTPPAGKVPENVGPALLFICLMIGPGLLGLLTILVAHAL